MAVLVMASCGGGSDKKADPGQFLDEIISVTETVLEKSEQAIRADDAEILVVAFEKFADQAVDIYNRYGDAFDGLSPEEQNKYRGKAIEMMRLMEEVQGLEYELNQLNLTPSQAKRMQIALEKMEILD